MPEADKAIKNLEEVDDYILHKVRDTASRKCRMADKVKDAIELLKEQDRPSGKFVHFTIKQSVGNWHGEKCSNCGNEYKYSAPNKWKYCPDCGAKMEGG